MKGRAAEAKYTFTEIRYLLEGNRDYDAFLKKAMKKFKIKDKKFSKVGFQQHPAGERPSMPFDSLGAKHRQEILYRSIEEDVFRRFEQFGFKASKTRPPQSGS